MKLALLDLRTEAQAEALAGRGTFTTVLEVTDRPRWARRQATLLLEGARGGVVLELGTVVGEPQRVATGQRRFRYTRVHELEWPIPVGAIEDALGPRLRRAFAERLIEPGLLPTATAEATFAAVENLDAGLAEILRDLLREATPDSIGLSGQALQAAGQEADSVRLAADIVGIPRSELAAPAPDGERSFLQRLDSVRVPEDAAIVYDSMRFLDFDRLEQPNGMVLFRRGRENLAVINVNRQPLETTTGADLIYVNETVDSFVLVQYKTMRREDGGGDGVPSRLVYRPDDRIGAQLDRMREVSTPEGDGTPGQWRLHPGCGFVKLCHPIARVESEPTQLVSGMYLPIDYWDTLTTSSQIRGPRDGLVFSYDTVGRHISNQLFVLLVRGGWIGTRGAASAGLTEQVISALRADRSVTVASAWSNSSE